jgi:steroid 5-alpha reductase family enzyme
LFEVIADNQLKNFKNKPQNKGKIMTKGLWRYSRHPNYFGEVTIWWGIFVITLSSFNGVMAIWSPILITYLLLFVSGIPMLEEKYKDNKEFIEYAKRTSVFFPLPPKRIKKEDK